MRVSFESGREITSLCAGWPAKRSLQQPTPAIVEVVVSLMQSPCGTPGVAVLSASVPEPGCVCLGGSAYVPTVTSLLLRPSDGTVFSEDVLVSVQTTIWLDT